MITITEALAELKTLGKRIDKKRDYVGQFLYRQDGIKDPLEKDGGSVEVLRRERQAIADLETRHVAIRTSIQKTNQGTSITVGDTTKTIAEWLTWRKEVAPGAQAFVHRLRSTVQSARQTAQQKGWGVVAAGGTTSGPADFVINVDEAELAAQAERFEAMKVGFKAIITLIARVIGQASILGGTFSGGWLLCGGAF